MKRIILSRRTALKPADRIYVQCDNLKYYLFNY